MKNVLNVKRIETHSFKVELFHSFCSCCKISFIIAGFLDKNRDTFNADLNDLVATSKCPFLLTLFRRELRMVRKDQFFCFDICCVV